MKRIIYFLGTPSFWTTRARTRCKESNMALFKYFTRKDVTQEAHEIPVKREESSAIGSDSKNKQRGSYLKFSPKEKAEIAKYASENGVVRAVRYFKEKNVKKSSIVDWKKAYEKELKKRFLNLNRG